MSSETVWDKVAEIHSRSKPCRICKGRTHHRDRKDRPFCAPCMVDAMPKDPRFASWQPGAAANFKEGEIYGAE